MIFDSVQNEIKATHCSREQALKTFEYLVNRYTRNGMYEGKKLKNGFTEPRFQIMKRAVPTDLF